VNFFAHYYFHNKQGDNWHNAGLLFPDLLRIFTSDQRISEKAGAMQIETFHHQNLSIGIHKHFDADDIFHNWQWFKDTNHKLALEIRNSDTDIKRDWFLAHILIELAIDHVLVSENESKVNDLYNDLGACGKAEWLDFFKEKGFGEADKWYENYLKFISHRYIFTYKDTDNVVYALNRIYQNTGIGKFNDTQNQFLVLLLNNFIPEVKLKLSELHKILE